ncbi:MAG: hypothetical protein EU518_01950 [Promethearchaeota archaeon]|nr:MAG: hypothetical protein EU518_01950 [Candidatus Lokiarchaeota archaeon]
MVQEINKKKYWFDEENLLKPIDWGYFNTLSNRVKSALELYMRGEISIGRASEIARMSYREFDLI